MPKALVDLRGRLLVDRAACVLRDGGCAPVLVVLGAAADEVIRRADLDGAQVVDNADWASGMASSLRAGLAALADTSAVAAVVLPVDVPGVPAAAVRRVLAAAAAGPAAALVAATYAGRQGHPVLLGRAHWAGVMATARGDAGARDYLRAHDVEAVPCDDIGVGTDVDVPGDLPEDLPS